MTDYHMKMETGKFKIMGSEIDPKKIVNKFIDLVPHIISIILIGFIFIVIIIYRIDYGQILDLIKVLIWPAVIFSATIFFKKVFTYLFFSMEEFNFFGAKGNLKSITEVIDEKVEIRLQEKAEKEMTDSMVSQFEEEIKKANLSVGDSKKEAKDNLNLAGEILKDYKELINENEKTIKELKELKKEKRERERMNLLIQKKTEEIRKRNELAHEGEFDTQNIDPADYWADRWADEARGK